MAEVFQFKSSASLEKLTGRKASNLEGLHDLIRTCSDSSIFYHTFSAFLKMREAEVPFNNDFAVWIYGSLNEKALAERVMAIDLAEHNRVEILRNRLIEVIEKHVELQPSALKKAGDEPFYLYDLKRFVYLTDKFAYDLKSFRELLPTVSIYSIYYHFIESRLETDLGNDDFSNWIENDLELPALAEKIRKIDISAYTLEGLRSRIMQMIDDQLGKAKKR